MQGTSTSFNPFRFSHHLLLHALFYSFTISSMAASSSSSISLKALVVFRNKIYEELLRAVHVYQIENGGERIVEREYLFHKKNDYDEMRNVSKILTRESFDVKQHYVGLSNGVWDCILVFDRDANADLEDIPDVLLTSRNPKLAAIPTLANDLDIVFGHNYERNNASQLLPILEAHSDFVRRSRRTPRVPMFDLNSPPPCEPENEESNPNVAGLVDKKQKRAAPKDVARLVLEDLVKYFDLPIAEASKNLNVGLTVLKRKCRQFGIPRWPHRKIKSLDGLIHILQEEVKRQEREDEAAAMVVAKRQRMIESEKESIERKPFLDIQLETKKFRQDIFKRRHEARVLEKSC